MSLLAEIQRDAVDDKVAVSTLLRKCKILAARLGHSALEEWVERELSGYPEDAALPPYRTPVPLRLLGDFANPARYVKNMPVPVEALPDWARTSPMEKPLRDPIGDVEAMAANAKGVITFAMPASLLPHVRALEMMECYSLWGEVSTMVFKNVLEQVRNSVLTFALEIEKENPGAGEAAPGSEPVPLDTVASIVNNTFYGGTNTVATNSPGTVQNVAAGITPGDVEALLTHFKESGVGEDDLAELRSAMAEDEGVREEGELGPRVKTWLGNMALKAATGLWQVGSATGANVLGAAIARHYGIL